jgi:hypothetical protein
MGEDQRLHSGWKDKQFMVARGITGFTPGKMINGFIVTT